MDLGLPVLVVHLMRVWPISDPLFMADGIGTKKNDVCSSIQLLGHPGSPALLLLYFSQAAVASESFGISEVKNCRIVAPQS